ncbi:rCG31905 [Rattus norvegicus]|uniref:RCG31905 n=1 Tax=Rattus norvegicus TaxID=10116 RepID=A6JNZ3_RAT|nr:rCG31905 [Rattus norvegicus]
MPHGRVHEVAGPTQHIAHTVLILKILGAEDTRVL